MIKDFITENLNKDFIYTLMAPFIASILLAKKPSSRLRFCIDYHKLNKIMKKNQYLILLIEETLTQLTKVKVFT